MLQLFCRPSKIFNNQGNRYGCTIENLKVPVDTVSKCVKLHHITENQIKRSYFSSSFFMNEISRLICIKTALQNVRRGALTY